MRRLLCVLALTLTVLLSSAHAAPGQTAGSLYLSTAADSPGKLYTVDPSTAAPTLVGSTNIGEANVAITGLAFHPTTNVLYGVTANISDVNPTSLVTVNPANGSVTLIGSLGSRPVVDISFRSDGTLFGWRKNAEAPDDLVTINLATGAVTSVGASGVSNTSGGGLAFTLGTLYLAPKNSTGALYTVNPTTGAATAGPTMDGNGTALQAMSANLAGTLFAIQGASTLVTINTSTGHITAVGTLTGVNTGDGLAFFGSGIGGITPTPTLTATGVPTNTPTSTPTNTPTNVPTNTPTRTPTAIIAAVAVPAVGQFGLLVLAGLIVAAGLFLIRLR